MLFFRTGVFGQAVASNSSAPMFTWGKIEEPKGESKE